VSLAIKDNYLQTLELLKEAALQGQHICHETGQVKVTYAMDIGHARIMEMFTGIWEDPHNFLDGINEGREEEVTNE
jgi:hypothetical protein